MCRYITSYLNGFPLFYRIVHKAGIHMLLEILKKNKKTEKLTHAYNQEKPFFKILLTVAKWHLLAASPKQ